MASIAVSWMMRISSLVLAFVSIPLIINAVGKDVYGQFSIIQGMLPWFLLLDMGTGHRVQNEIAIGKLQYAASVYFSILKVSLVVSVLLFLATQLLGDIVVKYLLKGDSSFYFYYTLSMLVFCIWGVIESITKIYYALFKSETANALMLVANMCSLLSIFLTKSQSLSVYIISLFVPQIIARVILLLMFFMKHHTLISRVSWRETMDFISRAKGFFAFAILSNLVLYFDYIAIALVLNPAQYADYTVVSRIYFAGFTLYTSVLAIYWSRFTKLLHDSKNSEATRLARMIIFSFFMAISACSVFLVLLLPEINKHLDDSSRISIDVGLIVSFSLYYMLRVWTDLHALILQSTDNMRMLLKLVPAQALMCITFQIVLGDYFGGTGVVWGLILSFLLSVSVALPREVYSRFKIRII